MVNLGQKSGSDSAFFIGVNLDDNCNLILNIVSTIINNQIKMKHLKKVFILSLFSIFLISCSGVKPKSTNKTGITENQISSDNTTANNVENENSSSTKNTSRDGSSIKNAIKVKSVSEEYQIVRKICPNCKMNSQALLSEGNKHYDLLKLTNEKGEEVKYYFDINSFYGKW